MRKRIKLLALATAFLCGTAFSEEITEQQARTVAENFVMKDSVGQGVLPDRTVDAVARRGGFYLVTLKPSGHVLVSVNRSAHPIPKFSEHDFVEPEAGSPQAAFLAQAETNAIEATGTKYEAQWKTLLGLRVLRLAASSAATTVAPLLKSSWSQGAPYYDFAPVNNGTHDPNGCVGTAYGQIMRYWEWPERIDEDFSTEHSADSTWGFAQQVWAGTALNWSDMSLSGFVSETDRLNIGRATMLCGMLARMGYASGGSKAQNKDVSRNPWYELPSGLDCDGTNAEAMKTAIVASLNAKCPILVGIGNPDHSIVCDGCSESGDTFYIHINYGWGGMETDNYTLDYVISAKSLSSIYHSQRPKPMVLADTMAAESTLPLTLKWAFPKKGYEDELTGFTIRYAEVDSAVYDWQDDFSTPKGTVDGAEVAVETVSCNNTTPVLNIRNAANQVHYTWPAKVLRADSALSFRVRSNKAIGMKVVVQAYNPSTGWETIYTPVLAESTVSDWQEIVLPLPQYAGKAIGLRVGAQRVSLQGASGDGVGVQFDDFKMTNVRDVSASGQSVNVAKDARSHEFTSTELSNDKTYVFTVEPQIAGGVVSPAVSTKIVSETSASASIDAIVSVRKTGYQVQQGFCRDGYLGLNQFGVYGSEATTGLVVRLSHPVLIDKSTPYFDTVDKKWGVTYGATSVVHAVSVEKVKNGKFLVKLDFGMLTEFVRTTRMMVTFDALDAKGNVARKHFNLFLNSTGGETAITKDQLPDYGGSAPETVYHTVTFDANGGTGGTQRQVLSGNAISAFPPVSWDGHTLVGWYTDKTYAVKVTADRVINESVTFYAKWVEVSGGGDEPGGETTGRNDFTDGGKTYRFCVGANKTSGYKDVSRIGTMTYRIPAAYNLVLWWGDAYKALNGSYPAGYSAPNTSSLDSEGNPFSLQASAVKLFKGSMSSAMPSDSDRAEYFPTVEYSAAEWCGGVTGDAMVKAAGRRIYAELSNGPIGCLLRTSSTSRGAVIWGCEYADDADGKYAKVLYITSTRVNNDGMENYQLDMISIEGSGTIPGLKNFNSAAGCVITTYYPIVGPAGKQHGGGGGGDDEPSTKTYTVVFDSDGGTAFSARSVVEGGTINPLPRPTKDGFDFDGWFCGGEELTTDTVITSGKTYKAKWTAKSTPSVPSDDPIGVASNAGDPGNFYTHYDYTMNDNYWTARKLAIQQRKQLFVLSGAAWCSNCSFVKDYLNSKAATVSANFIVYFSDHDSNVCNYFNGGLPQYGAADPRTVDAFTGTLNGEKRSWDLAWQKSTSGIYVQDRGGYAPERVQTVIDTGVGKARIGSPTNLVIRGLSTLATGHAGQYELYAQFDDGVEMPVDHGVSWTVVNGDGTIVEPDVEGKDVARLTINAGSVTIKATSTFYFTGSKSMTVAGADTSNVKSVTILTEEVNLEDDATPLLDAIATMNDGSTIPVAGFGDWSASFKSRIARADPELEEDNRSPSISFDDNSRLVYATTNGKLEVCDQKIDVTLTLNGKTTTKEVIVWGPTKVAPSRWKMISGPRQTALGVVRLQCTELKYNYGGKILKTTDTYFASYKTVLKYDGSGGTFESTLRGLTAIATSEKDGTCKVGLAATKVNGKYTGYAPADPTAAVLSTNFTNVAKGATVTDLEHGEVPAGFFNAFWPTKCAGKTADELKAFALEDSDGDSFANWEEYVLGTDPTHPGDAFTLMQGYQHLTAPAANGDTMQYKVMYQQRARRLYFIDAKSSWGDANWTQVAKVSLANMEEADVTKFTELNANYADNAKFFRVRAALYEHEFMHADDCPKIETKMLVANRGSVIDLTNEALPLALTSFDTDATDPGTVHVKVPASAKAGDVLITAPAAAAKSMAALAPQDLPDGLKFAVGNTADGRLALKVVSAATPSVEGGNATVVVANDTVVVTPDAGVTEVTLVHAGEMTVEIPASVDKIGGVASDRLVVRNGEHDVTKAMKFTPVEGGLKVELDDTKVVDVKGEDIPVRPVLAEADEGEPPLEIGETSVTVGVRTIPGLRYRLKTCAALGDGWTPVGEPQAATGARLRLTVERDANPAAFYTISVTK